MIEFHRIFCKIAANTGTVWTQWVVQECWRISVLQKIRQWNSFFVPLSFFMFLWILDTFSWYNSKLRPTSAFSFHDKWFKFQLCNKASRLVLGLWVADAYNDINGFSSFCFDRMFHRSKWNRFISAIGILSKPQTEKSFGTLYFNSYNASRIPNATISLYPTKAVESVPSSRICFVRLYPEEYSSIFGDSRLYSPGERERILTQSSPKPCSLKVATSAS